MKKTYLVGVVLMWWNGVRSGKVRVATCKTGECVQLGKETGRNGPCATLATLELNLYSMVVSVRYRRRMASPLQLLRYLVAVRY